MDASAEMAKLSLKSTVPAAPPKLKAGTAGTARKIDTNTYPISLKPSTPFYLHDIRIHAVYKKNGEEKLKELTKQTRDDFVEQERKEATVLAYGALKRLGVLKGDLSHDRAAQLFTTSPIPQCKGDGQLTHSLTAATAPDLFRLSSIAEASEVRVTIKAAAETYQVSTNDINTTDQATLKALLSVLNVGTSQELFNNPEEFIAYGNGSAYLMNPESRGFAGFDVGSQDKYGGVGLSKGARPIVGPKGAGAGITVDPKKTAFHSDHQLLSEKMSQLACDSHSGTQLLKGLKCVVHYSGDPKRKSRTMTVGSVSNMRVKDVIIEDDEKNRCTLVQYCEKKYNTKINPNLFAITDKYKPTTVYSPECLKIAPNQRVKTENIAPANIQRLIKESATLPSRRKAETATLAAALGISAANPAQVARGFTVDTSRPLTVDGRVLPPIQLGTGATPIQAAGPWAQGTVAQVPILFKTITILHLQTPREARDNLSTKVQKALIDTSKKLGFALSNLTIRPIVRPIVNQNEQEAQLRELIAAEKAAGSQFMIIISDLSIKNHALIKFLEVQMDIVTEQLTARVAQDMEHKSNTASNVALKVLEKLGGQNNYVSKTTSDLPAWVVCKGTMIVGLQMESPPSLSGKEKESNAHPSRPVFIGYSVNGVRGAAQRGATDAQNEKENTHFSSHWTYAMPKDFQGGAEYFAAYKEVALSTLRIFKKYREAIPTRILLVRGGVPEGDYDKIRSEEVPIWEAAFKAMNAAYSPTFIIVTANQMHSDRFYQEKIPSGPQDKAPKQNLPSGTVIDSGVTNPALSMAFVQAHVPLQGTAKVPSYVAQHVVLNPVHKMTFTMDDMIRTMHALCFTHGVCNTPTSVPTPLYVARESMKRANELFVFWSRRSGRLEWTIDEVIKELTMKSEAGIHGLRVNA